MDKEKQPSNDQEKRQVKKPKLSSTTQEHVTPVIGKPEEKLLQFALFAQKTCPSKAKRGKGYFQPTRFNTDRPGDAPVHRQVDR